jgi:hypothetical protein
MEQAGFVCGQVFPAEGLGIFLRRFDPVWADESLKKTFLSLS